MNNVQQINIEEIQKKLVDGISDTDWYGLLNHFITKSEFREILEELLFTRKFTS